MALLPANTFERALSLFASKQQCRGGPIRVFRGVPLALNLQHPQAVPGHGPIVEIASKGSRNDRDRIAGVCADPACETHHAEARKARGATDGLRDENRRLEAPGERRNGSPGRPGLRSQAQGLRAARQSAPTSGAGRIYGHGKR